MNLFHKGTLTVILATLITSVLILLTGTSAADKDEKSPVSKTDSESMQALKDTAKKSVGATVAVGVATKAVIEANNGVLDKKNIEPKKTEKQLMLTPPPIGPFQEIVKFSNSSEVAPNKAKNTAPKAPQSPVSSQPKNMPEKPVKPLLKGSDVPAPIKAELPKTPELNHTKPSISSDSASVLKSPKAPVKPKGVATKPNQPVWVQKKMQKPPAPVQNAFTQQAPVQRYMYVPVPVNPPQFIQPQYYPAPPLMLPQQAGVQHPSTIKPAVQSKANPPEKVSGSLGASEQKTLNGSQQ